MCMLQNHMVIQYAPNTTHTSLMYRPYQWVDNQGKQLPSTAQGVKDGTCRVSGFYTLGVVGWPYVSTRFLKTARTEIKTRPCHISSTRHQ